MTDYRGIDYGCGLSNVDTATNIRYGVIPVNTVTQVWCDSSEPDYGDPICPECGRVVTDDLNAIEDDVLETYATSHGCDDYACESCKHLWDSSDVWRNEPLGFNLDDGTYKAMQGGDDCDIFILKSPYYTRAQFCSPCAPGACYLLNPCPDGEKAYCFLNDWFDDDSLCPYPIWKVSDDSVVYTPASENIDE